MRQNYQQHNFFPIQCYEFRCSQILLDNTLNLIKDLEYKSYNQPTGVKTSPDLHDREVFSPLMSWFQQCVDTIHFDTGLDCDRLAVNKAWANRSLANTGHHHDAHRHPMSYLSGIFYLTPGPPTIFVDPLFQREWASFHLDGTIAQEVAFHGGPGGLIIFPSYMIHASLPNHDNVDRYTIAFNTFPTGNINSGGHDAPMSRVKVDAWQDLGPLKLSDYARD